MPPPPPVIRTCWLHAPRGARLHEPEFLAHLGGPITRGADVLDDGDRALDQLGVGRQHALAEPEVVFEPDAHVAARQHRRGDIGHLVAARAQKAEKVQSSGTLLTIAMKVLRSSGAPQGTPMHSCTSASGSRMPSATSCLANHRCPVSKASISGFTPSSVIIRAHVAQHAGRVGHHVVGLGEVHRAAIEGADLRQAFGDMGDAFGGPHHVGAAGERQRRFAAAEHHVAAHAGGEVQHHVDLGRRGSGRSLRGIGQIARRARRSRGRAHGNARRPPRPWRRRWRCRRSASASAAHAGCGPGSTPEPVTAQVMKTSRFMVSGMANSKVAFAHANPLVGGACFAIQ